MKKLLDNYVYENIERFGNTVISESDYDELGEDKIIKHLRKWGFECKIKVYDHYVVDKVNNVTTNSRDIIIYRS